MFISDENAKNVIIFIKKILKNAKKLLKMSIF